jgi:anti-anti-sigma factor
LRRPFSPGGVMNIETLSVGNGRGYVLRGEFDLECIPRVEQLFFNGDSSIPVILECSELTFMDSTGLWILLRLARVGDGTTPGVVVRNPSQVVRRLINIALPAGVDGLEVEFRGSGPGAAHLFSELLRSTGGLLARVEATHDAAGRACASAGRIRAESVERRTLRARAA